MISLHDISEQARNLLFLESQMTFRELCFLSYRREIIHLTLKHLTVSKPQEETKRKVNPPEQPPKALPRNHTRDLAVLCK